MKNKKAGFEMSITTLVIIVIAVVMLIMGLVLVRQIFGVATKSVSVIDASVRQKLISMLGEEGKDIVTYYKEVKIKRGDSGTFAFGVDCVNAIEGRENVTFMLDSKGDCGLTFTPELSKEANIDEYSGTSGFADITIDVSSTASPGCTQRVYIDPIKCLQDGVGKQTKGGTYFTVKVIRGGFLG